MTSCNSSFLSQFIPPELWDTFSRWFTYELMFAVRERNLGFWILLRDVFFRVHKQINSLTLFWLNQWRCNIETAVALLIGLWALSLCALRTLVSLLLFTPKCVCVLGRENLLSFSQAATLSDSVTNDRLPCPPPLFPFHFLSALVED